VLTDFRLTDRGAALSFDVCIIGGGIAGLTLANALNGQPLQVAVFEAGGMAVTAEAQAFFEADVVGAPYTGHTSGRFRALGGSSLRWGAQLLPLHRSDFEKRAHIEHSGWPIGIDDIQPYYDRVQRLLRVNALPFDASLAARIGFEPLPFDRDRFAWRYSKWARFRHRNVWDLFGAALRRSRNIHVFYNAPVLRLRHGAAPNTVTAALVASANTDAVAAHARCFVLCLGTLENARLLLASNDVAPQGIGNNHGNVGRYFHDHASFCAGRLTGVSDARIPGGFAPRFVRQVMHYPRVELTRQAQDENTCSAVFAHLQFEHGERSAFGAMRAVLRRMQAREWFVPTAAEALNIVGDFPYFARLAASFALGGRVPLPPGATCFLAADVEQEPNPDSRVYLSEKRDALGQPRLEIDWKVTERQRHSAEVFTRGLASEWRRLGLDDVEWRIDELASLKTWQAVVHDTFHQAGTTRMADSAAHGVVDRDLRIHGVENVFVAGCSVFPTGGSANPTFTMMALTLRLAEHLQRLLTGARGARG
jgi:choline dehydrogenase-like flavoprotein